MTGPRPLARPLSAPALRRSNSNNNNKNNVYSSKISSNNNNNNSINKLSDSKHPSVAVRNAKEEKARQKVLRETELRDTIHDLRVAFDRCDRRDARMDRLSRARRSQMLGNILLPDSLAEGRRVRDALLKWHATGWEYQDPNKIRPAAGPGIIVVNVQEAPSSPEPIRTSSKARDPLPSTTATTTTTRLPSSKERTSRSASGSGSGSGSGFEVGVSTILATTKAQVSKERLEEELKEIGGGPTLLTKKEDEETAKMSASASNKEGMKIADNVFARESARSSKEGESLLQSKHVEQDKLSGLRLGEDEQEGDARAAASPPKARAASFTGRMSGSTNSKEATAGRGSRGSAAQLPDPANVRTSFASSPGNGTESLLTDATSEGGTLSASLQGSRRASRESFKSSAPALPPPLAPMAINAPPLLSNPQASSTSALADASPNSNSMLQSRSLEELFAHIARATFPKYRQNFVGVGVSWTSSPSPSRVR